MTIEQARENLSQHVKPGYKIREVYNKEVEATYVFLDSHKNRTVGAICLCDDGDMVIPDSVLESQEWSESV